MQVGTSCCQISRIFRELPYLGPYLPSPADRSQNLPYLTRRSLDSEIYVLETFCSLLIVHSTIFIARQHTDALYSDMAILSVRPSVHLSDGRNVPVLDEKGYNMSS